MTLPDDLDRLGAVLERAAGRRAARGRRRRRIARGALGGTSAAVAVMVLVPGTLGPSALVPAELVDRSVPPVTTASLERMCDRPRHAAMVPSACVPTAMLSRTDAAMLEASEPVLLAASPAVLRRPR